MTIVSVFIALLSFLIACLALTFTIGSFWWLNARQGRLTSFEPHSFAAVAIPMQSRVRFPLVLYNTGAKPIGNYSALLLCWASEVVWFGDADV
jgi:hypothetical protein